MAIEAAPASLAMSAVGVAVPVDRVDRVGRVVIVVAVDAAARVVAVAPVAREEADVDNANATKTIKITCVRSMIGYPQDQRDTLKALGISRINQTVERPDSPQLRGQIFKVKHLIRVEE